MTPSMEERRERCKIYCRIPTCEDDLLVESLIRAADSYLGNAGVFRTDRNADQYDLVLHAMVLKWYDNREGEAATGATGASLNLGIRHFIQQLKQTCPFDGAADGEDEER